MRLRRSKPQPAPAAEPATVAEARQTLPHEPVMTPADTDAPRSGLRREAASATIDLVRGESATDRLRNGRSLSTAD